MSRAGPLVTPLTGFGLPPRNWPSRSGSHLWRLASRAIPGSFALPRAIVSVAGLGRADLQAEHQDDEGIGLYGGALAGRVCPGWWRGRRNEARRRKIDAVRPAIQCQAGRPRARRQRPTVLNRQRARVESDNLAFVLDVDKYLTLAVSGACLRHDRRGARS